VKFYRYSLRAVVEHPEVHRPEFGGVSCQLGCVLSISTTLTLPTRVADFQESGRVAGAYRPAPPGTFGVLCKEYYLDIVRLYYMLVGLRARRGQRRVRGNPVRRDFVYVPVGGTALGGRRIVPKITQVIGYCISRATGSQRPERDQKGH
jgi:hypothetical protein